MSMFAAFQEHSEKFRDLKQVCLETLAIHVVARAFNSGIFSNQEFKNNFKTVKNYILSTPKLKPFRKWKFKMACNGAYWWIYFPQHIIKTIKHSLR